MSSPAVLAPEALACATGAGTATVWGPDGSGKSSTLACIAELAADAGRIPLTVGPFNSDRDADAMVLSGLVEQMATSGVLDDAALRRLTDGTTLFSARLTTVRWYLGALADRWLVLADEPAEWRGERRENGDLLRQTLLRDVPWPVVSAATRPTAGWRSFGLSEVTVPQAADWPAGAIRDALELVKDAPPAPALVQRLRVAVATIDQTRLLAPSLTVAQAAERTARGLSASRQWRPLWVLWQRLARERSAIDRDLVREFGGDRLATDATTLLNTVLLSGPMGEMHPVVREVGLDADFAPRVEGSAANDAHRVLFRRHRSRMQVLAAEDSAFAIVEAGEALHHAAEVGDASLTWDLPALVSDHLDALGHRLSVVHRQFADAAAVFERVVDLVVDDDYAHHYLAFNMDVQGVEPGRVERALSACH